MLVETVAYVIEREQKPLEIDVIRNHRQSSIGNAPETQMQRLPAPSTQDDFNCWYATYIERGTHRLDDWGSEFLDEISILSEQLRAQQRKTAL